MKYDAFNEMVGFVPQRIMMTGKQWMDVQGYIGKIHKQVEHRKKPNIDVIARHVNSIDLVMSLILDKAKSKPGNGIYKVLSQYDKKRIRANGGNEKQRLLKRLRVLMRLAKSKPLFDITKLTSKELRDMADHEYQQLVYQKVHLGRKQNESQTCRMEH